MYTPCVKRENPMDIVHDSRGIVVQGKSILHEKMLNEG
jgi:hypothetical protein